MTNSDNCIVIIKEFLPLAFAFVTAHAFTAFIQMHQNNRTVQPVHP